MTYFFLGDVIFIIFHEYEEFSNYTIVYKENGIERLNTNTSLTKNDFLELNLELISIHEGYLLMKDLHNLYPEYFI